VVPFAEEKLKFPHNNNFPFLLFPELWERRSSNFIEVNNWEEFCFYPKGTRLPMVFQVYYESTLDSMNGLAAGPAAL
jgi:hypothetical protein